MRNILKSAAKIRKGKIVHHIRGNKALERCQINLVQLVKFLTIKIYSTCLLW